MLSKEQKVLLERIEKGKEHLIGYVTHCRKPKPEPNVFAQRYVCDCYSRPSFYKIRAEKFIEMFMDELNNTEELYAHSYTVVGYNFCMFTAIFLVKDRKTDKNICYYYFTKDYTRRYEIL